jgi:hypothetical protein
MAKSSRRVIALTIQVDEPPVITPVERVRRGEVFLSGAFTTLCLGQLDTRKAISWHFIRYLDPGHLTPATGIVILLSILGSTIAIASARRLVDEWLSRNMANAGITHCHWIDENDWKATNHQEYGGPDTADEFAEFLHAGSVLTLRLLQSGLRGSRDGVLNGWRHCFNYVTIGYDWTVNGPVSVDAAP